MFLLFVGQTCLHLAAEGTHLPVMRQLLKKGSNINTQVRLILNEFSDIKLHWYCQKYEHILNIKVY